MDSVSLVTFAIVCCAIWDPRRIETANVTHHKLRDVDLNILRSRLGKNTVVSSFAFRLPLCKLAAAAATATRHEIISVLDIQTLSETKTCFSSLFPALSALLETDLTMLNKIYVNYTSEIDDQFILGAASYGVTVSKIGYDYQRDAVAYVNREFESKTYMRIRDVLELSDINAYSSILLVNGFHYKGIWEMPFTASSTQNKHFRSGQKTLQLEMMQTLMQCSYLNDPQARFKAVSFHLSQRGIYVTFVLPYQNSSIVDLLRIISQAPDFLDSVNKRMEWKFVDLALPKFKIKTCLDWTPYLKQIGLNLTTNIDNTGLNKISKNVTTRHNMYVSRAKQKLFVEIDEGPKGNAHVAAPPMVNADEAQDMPRAPVALEKFTVDGPLFFSVSINVPPLRAKEKPRLFQVFNGVYYGPDGN